MDSSCRPYHRKIGVYMDHAFVWIIKAPFSEYQHTLANHHVSQRVRRADRFHPLRRRRHLLHRCLHRQGHHQDHLLNLHQDHRHRHLGLQDHQQVHHRHQHLHQLHHRLQRPQAWHQTSCQRTFLFGCEGIHLQTFQNVF